MKITDHDIQRTERLLLPRGCHFNDERRVFLRCMESRDVVACPGSGKTTALLAKLLILSARMPFTDGRGLCVLTHTNVAIDQIKRKAGVAAEALFRHPNFFGTIQEFANRFLAIPAYVARFGQRHIRMDEDLYENRSHHVFFEHKLLWNGAIFGPIAERIKQLSKEEKISAQIQAFRDLAFRFDGDFVSYVSGRRTLLQGKRPAKNYATIHAAKYGLLKEGYLRYQDAFPLALWYLQQNSTLPDVFAHRFAFVFVDEAQDTNAEQFGMLDAAFADKKRSVVQFLGDPNQAIYNFTVKKDVDWTPGANPINFSDTLRFGSKIAAILGTVRIDNQISLLPNRDRPSLLPYLLTFTQGEEELVLPAFVQLLKDSGLDRQNDGTSLIFKAVGWVGKDKRDQGKPCLQFYLPGYQGRTIRSRRHFKNLLSYIQSQPGIAAVFRNTVLRGICQALTVAGIQHPSTNHAFTRNTLLMWLRDANEPARQELLTLLARWCLQSECRDRRPNEIRDQIATYLRKNWGDLKPSADFDEFVSDEEIELQEWGQPVDNLFRDGDITIEVGTVHSVKGETHTATLYLETYYKKTDSQRLLPFLKGDYPPKLVSKAEHIENLKIAHVAMSRPTHLLAFACCKDSISGHEDALAKNGWQICTVEELCGKTDNLNAMVD
jgi:DNA helicase-2/ATP-dependent DNA helicase PcrA